MTPSESRASTQRSLHIKSSQSSSSGLAHLARHSPLKIHRRHRSKPRISHIPSSSIPTFGFHDPNLPPSPPHTVDLPPTPSLRAAESDDEDGLGEDVMEKRLDSMTARLRELILEGQRALSAESPVVSEEGWMDAADPRDDRWRRGHPKAVPVTARSAGRVRGSRRTISQGGPTLVCGT